MNSSRDERENGFSANGMSTVGAWLKTAREEKGETIDEVASITRIGKSYLEAIEAGAVSRLPSQAYTRGFIRLYAAHLGLPPDEVISGLTINPSANHPDITESTHQNNQRVLKSSSYRRLITVLVILAVFAVSAYILLKPAQKSNVTQSPPRKDPAPALSVATAPATLEKPADVTAPPDAPQQKNSENQGIILRLKAVSDGRIHITIDGSISQEYDLVAGDIVEWKAENAFALDLENAASVEGELDGKRLQPFGAQGKAAHLVLKADNIRKE